MEQETRKRSVREICKDPNSITEDEKADILKMREGLRELGKAAEPYSDIKPIHNNTATTLSKRFYQEHFIMSAILEAFFIKNEISFAELNKTIFNYVPKEFGWDISVAQINLIIYKMIRLGFVEPLATENEYAPMFKITLDGVKAYQTHTFQTLATSSFFSYQTYQLNRKMLWVTIISVIVAISSVVVTILVTTKSLG